MKVNRKNFIILQLSCIGVLLTCNVFAEDAEDWMPDPVLRTVVRKAIGLPPAVPLTKDKMLWFDYLHAWNSNITDLTGLEWATNLRDLGVCGNQISDLTPLVDLIHLEYLGLCVNQISDVSPLANLIHLKGLDLGANKVSDITPLRNLIELEWINLGSNPVENIEILANFTKLKSVRLDHTSVLDFTPLSGLTLTEFIRDEICEIPPVGNPVTERIQNRTFPSIALPGSSFVRNTNPVQWFGSEDVGFYYEHISKHDLNYFGTTFGLWWFLTPSESHYGLSTRLGGNLENSKREHQKHIKWNPNMLFLPEIRLHNHFRLEAFPQNSDFWVRDADGNFLKNDEVGWDEFFFDIFNPEVQQLLINRIVGLAECGLLDGVLLDGFFEHGALLYAHRLQIATVEEAIEVHKKILKGVRERVRDDFLILVNANRTKVTRYAEYVNGSYMETVRDHPDGYTYKGLQEIEDTLIWNEENLREPRINVLEGHGVFEPFESLNNLRWMRLFTTMSLTHSDGYSIFRVPREIDGYIQHVHIWYSFWDADLGQPIGEKAQLYRNREGLFIREFTNGWGVYNRSGTEQTIHFSEQVTGVASEKNGIQHIVFDLDGEIFLKKTADPHDVNGDGVVNILDLVAVANAFGKSVPDVNGDGTVNVLDLVAVANAF